jgi:hypothetical protein
MYSTKQQLLVALEGEVFWTGQSKFRDGVQRIGVQIKLPGTNAFAKLYLDADDPAIIILPEGSPSAPAPAPKPVTSPLASYIPAGGGLPAHTVVHPQRTVTMTVCEPAPAFTPPPAKAPDNADAMIDSILSDL